VELLAIFNRSFPRLHAPDVLDATAALDLSSLPQNLTPSIPEIPQRLKYRFFEIPFPYRR
jgi:hypothetical protein